MKAEEARPPSLKKGIRERIRDRLRLSVKAACFSEHSLSDAQTNAKLSAIRGDSILLRSALENRAALCSEGR